MYSKLWPNKVEGIFSFLSLSGPLETEESKSWRARIGNLVHRLSACLYLFSHLPHVSPEKLKYKPDGRKPFVRRGCAYSDSPKNQDWVLWVNVWRGAWKIISTPVKALPRLSVESRQIPGE